MKIRIQYKDAAIDVDDSGKIYQNGNELRYFRIRDNPYLFADAKSESGRRLVNVGRAVCQAFHPNENSEGMQADHIDSNPANNKASNLRWTTRKFNNSRRHTRKMKSVNAKSVSHDNEVLKATREGATRYFRNGIEAARILGCSHVLVYNAIRGKFVNKAKGWKLEWIPRGSDECRDFVKGLDGERGEMKAKAEKAAQLVKNLRNEYRDRIRRIKDECRIGLMLQKAEDGAAVHASKTAIWLKYRILLWKAHLDKLEEQAAERASKPPRKYLK